MNALRRFIGKRWAVPCNPPDSYDCWQLAIDVRAVLGLDTPNYAAGGAHSLDLRCLIAEPPAEWKRLSGPRTGCVVRMCDHAHVGVFLGAGRVIHAQQRNGVRVDDLAMLRRFDPDLSFWELSHV